MFPGHEVVRCGPWWVPQKLECILEAFQLHRCNIDVTLQGWVIIQEEWVGVLASFQDYALRPFLQELRFDAEVTACLKVDRVARLSRCFLQLNNLLVAPCGQWALHDPMGSSLGALSQDYYGEAPRTNTTT